MTDRDHQLLDLAGRRWATDSHLEQAMVDATGLSSWRCWQALNALLDVPAAWEHAPVVCRRLAARRSHRRRQAVRFAHEEAPQ